MGKGIEKFEYSIDLRLIKKKRPFQLAFMKNLREAEVNLVGPQGCGCESAANIMYRKSKLDFAIVTGGHMERTAEQLQMINEEVVESKKVLEGLYNELSSVLTQLNPLFREQIKSIRDARMASVSEIQLALVAMRDIRKFFLEEDYEKEMKRLSEFVELCREMKRLKEEGTLDALCDLALKLAARDERRAS